MVVKETVRISGNMSDHECRMGIIATLKVSGIMRGQHERAERRAAVIDTPLAVRVAIRYDWIERIS